MALFLQQDLIVGEEHRIAKITEIRNEISEITDDDYRQASKELTESSQYPPDHVIVIIKIPIYYGPDNRPLLHGPQNLGVRMMCDSKITWLLLLLIGLEVRTMCEYGILTEITEIIEISSDEAATADYM